MKLNDATDIYLGETPVDEVYLGEQLIWRRDRSDKYLRLEPTVIWIVDELPQVVEVQSNTEWAVE